MSNSNKHCLQLTAKDGTVKKVKRHKKMSPYSKGQEAKWVLDNSSDVTSSLKTKAKKEEIKNANRSLKKGLRQQLKRDLENQVDEYFID